VRAEWNGWIAQHQADQTAIDPYTALLDCSGGGESADSSAPGGGQEPTADLSGLDEDLDLGS
jgi:hypothetical protein